MLVGKTIQNWNVPFDQVVGFWMIESAGIGIIVNNQSLNRGLDEAI
jgi:hypothetical protein